MVRLRHNVKSLRYPYAVTAFWTPIVACGGVYVSYMANRQTEVYQQRCIALLEENRQLREQLAEVQPAGKKVEMVFSVGSQEFAPKTLARQNRNFCNVKSLSNGQVWDGQIGTDRFGHAIFEHPAYSIRACAIILRTYEIKHGIKTVKGMVKRYATGNQEAYTKFLCKKLGVNPEQKISLTERLPDLLPAIIHFETGLKVGSEYTGIIEAVMK